MDDYNKSLFLEVSDQFLGRKFIEEWSHLIDDFAQLPVVNILYLEDADLYTQLGVLSISLKVSKFDNLIDCVSFIEMIREENFFYINSITIRNNKVRLRYVDVPLDMRIPGLMSVRAQRIRNKKINEILG